MDNTKRINHAHIVEMSRKLKHAPTGILNPNRLKTLEDEQPNSKPQTSSNQDGIDTLQRETGYRPE